MTFNPAGRACGVVLAAMTMAVLAACSAPSADEAGQHRPQQAGQPMDPARTAAHMTTARMAAMSGDQAGVQRSVDAMSDDMRRSMRLPDPSRPIDKNAARAIARAMPGVRSANWVDRTNLLVRVDGAQLRSQRTIDELCYRLEALGDTLAVVVHLQNAAPETRDQMDTLSRNCQLAPGEQAFLQRERKLDALDPAERARQRAFAEQVRENPPRELTPGDRAAIEAMPEM